MILLGLLLIAAAVAAAVILVVQNDGNIVIHIFNSDYNVAAYWLAVAGLVIMAVLALGLWAVRAGTAYRWRRRRERRELVRENRRLSERQAVLQDRAPERTAATGPVGTEPAGRGTSRVDAVRADEPVRPAIDEPGRMPPAER